MKSVTSTLFVTLLVLLAPAANHAQNVNISQGIIFDGEPFLALNPNNPQHLVVAWMGFVPQQQIVIKTRVSFDGGRTWSPVKNIPHTKPSYSSADPSLEFDDNGNVYVCFVDYNKFILKGSVVVARSIDGGLNWQAPAEVINADDDPGKIPIDRPWIAIDRSGGPYDGNLYVTSMTAGLVMPVSPPYHPYFMRSTDGGNSFSGWRYLDTANWLSGNIIKGPMAFPATAADGTLYIAYSSYVPAQNIYPQLILAKSTDGGNSFQYSTIASNKNNFSDPDAKRSYILCANPDNADELAFLFLSADNGHSDVYMIRSTDGGINWSQRVKVNDDPATLDRMQDMVWASYNSRGDLVVSWRDRRNGSDPSYQTSYEFYAAVNYKNQSGFSPNFRISDTIIAFDTILNGSGNDFMSLRTHDDTLYAVWGDTRNGKMNIWFQRMMLDGTLISIKNIAGKTVPDVSVYPNPVSDLLRISAIGITDLALYTRDGKLIKSSRATGNEVFFDLCEIPPGIYYLAVKTKAGYTVQSIVKQ